MRALTYIQPWASLVVDGRKPWETRSWSTAFRGKHAIHAGAKVDRVACREFGYDPDTIPTRAILGTAVLTDCVRFPHPDVAPDPYGDYSHGRYGFRLDGIVKFAEPIPAVGMLGFWDWKEGGEQPVKSSNQGNLNFA